MLAGVASTTGAYGFTVTATDADGCAGSASYLLPVARGRRAPDDQVGLVIPASGTGGSGDPQLDTVTSALVVPEIASQAVAVTGLEVHVTLLHERTGDLVLTLVSPDGTRIQLADRRGGVGQDYLGTVFSDTGTEGVCDGAPPFIGSHRPEEPLGVRPVNGTWTLEIVDAAVGSTGLLVDWSLDVRTASAGRLLEFDLMDFKWYRTLATPVGQVAMDEAHLYFTGGSSVSKVLKHQPGFSTNWTRSFMGPETRNPVVVNRSFQAPPFLAVNHGGFALGLALDDGSTLWSRDLRRPTCTTDSLAASTGVQLWNRSDCAYRSAVPGDSIFLGTRAGCTGTYANRIFALDPANGNLRWTFNSTGSTQMASVTGLVADPSRNRLFVASEKPDPTRIHSTVWAFDTRTGTRVWSDDKQDIQAAPILAEGLFVLSTSGELHKLDPDSGTTTWSLTLAGGTRSFEHDMALDPVRGWLFAVDSSGELHAVEDLGSSATLLWTQATIADLQEVVVTPTLGWVYASARSGRIYQIDELSGTIDRFKQAPFPTGDAPRFLVDETVGGGLVEARLTLWWGQQLARAPTGWTPFDRSGEESEDYPRPPFALLSVAGHTLPASASLGDTVTDTLTVTNQVNHAPDCVVVRATLPPGASLVDATVPDGTVSQVGDQLVARLGRVEIGESVVLTLTLRPGRGGTFARTYSASSELPVPGVQDPLVTLENEVWKVRPRKL